MWSMGVWVAETRSVFGDILGVSCVITDLHRFEQAATSGREAPMGIDGHGDVYIRSMIILELRVFDVFDILSPGNELIIANV
jgi:hypothetical protein